MSDPVNAKVEIKSVKVVVEKMFQRNEAGEVVPLDRTCREVETMEVISYPEGVPVGAISLAADVKLPGEMVGFIGRQYGSAGFRASVTVPTSMYEVEDAITFGENLLEKVAQRNLQDLIGESSE